MPTLIVGDTDAGSATAFLFDMFLFPVFGYFFFFCFFLALFISFLLSASKSL